MGVHAAVGGRVEIKGGRRLGGVQADLGVQQLLGVQHVWGTGSFGGGCWSLGGYRQRREMQLAWGVQGD